MNDLNQEIFSINNIIQKTWKWPKLLLSVYLDNNHLLDATFLKIKNTWVSLPHQSQNGLLWNEDFITKFLDHNISIGKLNPEEFYQAIFFALNQALNSNKVGHPEQSEGFTLGCKETHNSDPPTGLEESLSIKKVCHSEQSEESPDYMKMCQSEHIFQLDSKTLQSFSYKKTKSRLFIRSNRPLSPYNEARKVISELKLRHSFNDQMQFFSSSVRRKIQKAKRNGIKVEIGSSKDLDLFYAIYRKRIHQLGSMGLPKKYFHHLLQNKNSHWAKLLLAFYKDRYIGTAILNIHSNSTENLYFATSKKHNYLYPSYALHAKMIDLSIKANCSHYSFGRSTINSGVHRYKQQWGTKDKILYYNYSWDKKDHLWIQKLAKVLIPFFPLSFIKRFDYAISKICY
jgi:hypothetical protein